VVSNVSREGYCQTLSPRTYESAGGSTLHSDDESQEDSEAFVLEVSVDCTRYSQSAWLHLQTYKYLLNNYGRELKPCTNEAVKRVSLLHGLYGNKWSWT
jgi:hypothetical protein